MMGEQELKKADRHIKNAWIAGIIVIIWTTFLIIFSLIGVYSEILKTKYGLDAWSFIDVALIACLTFGIYKKSRFCALGLLLYLLLSKSIQVIQFENLAISSIIIAGISTLLFGYFFFQGTRATFQIHKHLVETGQKSKKKRSTIFYIAFGILGLFIIAVGYIFILALIGPENEVLPGKQLNIKYSTFIREQELIEDDDEIIFWYSDGYSDFKSGFYFFTKENVIIYSKDWEEPAIIMPFTIINDIKFEHNPSFFEDSRIILMLNDGSEVFFPVSSENGGDKRFYNALTKMWESKRLKSSHMDQ